MTPKERAKEVCKDIYHIHSLDGVQINFLARVTQAIEDAVREAYEDAAKASEYWCDKGFHGEHCENECSASRIRARAKG